MSGSENASSSSRRRRRLQHTAKQKAVGTKGEFGAPRMPDPRSVDQNLVEEARTGHHPTLATLTVPRVFEKCVFFFDFRGGEGAGPQCGVALSNDLQNRTLHANANYIITPFFTKAWTARMRLGPQGE